MECEWFFDHHQFVMMMIEDPIIYLAGRTQQLRERVFQIGLIYDRIKLSCFQSASSCGNLMTLARRSTIKKKRNKKGGMRLYDRL